MTRPDRAKRGLPRRAVLRAAGVALTLPWLESLLPREVRAQASAAPRRFLPIYLPNGASEFWRPTSAGSGDAWKLSSILEPFATGASLKPKLNVVSGLENASVFGTEPNVQIEGSHGRLGGAWLTCVDAAKVRAELGVDEANGISADQLIAQHPLFRDQTALPSLQVGLSTPLGNCDGQPCSSSRSVSWASARQPLYKLVDPLEVFNRMVSLVPEPDPNSAAAIEAQKRRERNKSVLDAVLENAKRTRALLGTDDKLRMDQFLDSVRSVEKRVAEVSDGARISGCELPNPEVFPHAEQSPNAPRQSTQGGYDKGAHADAMNALIVMAFECDITRVVSYMLEDERSEFVYSHVQERAFTAESSTEKGGACPEYHVAQHGAGDPFATITWWNVGKVAELCRSLDAREEAPGVSLLDNTVVLLAGSMEGGSHLGINLPVALIGGQNCGLTADQHLVLDGRPLRDLYFTLFNDVYGLDVTDFGQNLKGAPLASIRGLISG